MSLLSRLWIQDPKFVLRARKNSTINYQECPRPGAWVRQCLFVSPSGMTSQSSSSKSQSLLISWRLLILGKMRAKSDPSSGVCFGLRCGTFCCAQVFQCPDQVVNRVCGFCIPKNAVWQVYRSPYLGIGCYVKERLCHSFRHRFIPIGFWGPWFKEFAYILKVCTLYWLMLLLLLPKK